MHQPDTQILSRISKEENYKVLIPGILSLVREEKNLTANLGNICSALKYSFEYFSWVGFYFTDSENPQELVLGPFQGRVACTRLKIGKGVCGTAITEKRCIIVPDVSKFPGHIYCDPESKSEIVMPVIINGTVKGVLDIDSNVLSAFDETDKNYLEELLNKVLYIFRI